MRLPPYPKYKPSGVDWLGDVPEHWGLGRISGLFRLRSGGTPSTDNADYWDGDIPWVSAKDMKCFRIADTEDHITSKAVLESATTIVPAGTVLIVARSGILKHTLPVAVSDRPVAINQDIKGLLPQRDRIDGLFFAYCIQGHQPPLLTLWRQQGATVESLDIEKMKVAPVSLPPLSEQRAIADFLDRETTKIDTLVAKKRTLIERVKEKRTALISRTVTRGLPPDDARAAGLVPHPKLKPSGIDWLGDVPEHWATTKFRFLVTGTNAGEVIDRSYWHLGGEALFSCQREPMLSDYPDFPASKRTGYADILVTRNGTPYVHLPSPNAIYSNVVQRCTLRGGVDRRFIALALEQACETLRGEGYGVSIPSFSYEKWCDLSIPLPAIEEQRAITTYVDRETAKIDGMVAKVETAIERLQEYRTALVNAAVTGKIDVRGAVA
jgi:type I restriction enzyme S subunit